MNVQSPIHPPMPPPPYPTGDPLIDEVRAIRHAISEQFGHDVSRLCDHLREVQNRPEFRARIVRREDSLAPKSNVA